MRFARILLVTAVSALLAACDGDSSDVVVAHVDPAADFTQYRTFAISDASAIPAEVAAMIPASSKANMDYVNQLAAAELLDHGLTQVGRDQDPDLVVQSLVWTEDQTALYYTCVPGSYWYGYWYYTWDPCAWLTPYIAEYEQGTILVGTADPVMMKIVFGGIVQGVTDAASQEERMLRATDGVERIFNNYPVDFTP